MAGWSAQGGGGDGGSPFEGLRGAFRLALVFLTSIILVSAASHNSHFIS